MLVCAIHPSPPPSSATPSSFQQPREFTPKAWPRARADETRARGPRHGNGVEGHRSADRAVLGVQVAEAGSAGARLAAVRVAVAGGL
jgi:hypothetical protein